MNNLQLVGFAALLSMAVACTASTEPTPGKDGEQTSPIAAQQGPSQAPAGGKPAAPAKTSTPAPAPAPIAGCTALPGPTGTANPAAVYCIDLGYKLNGEQCAFADGTSCEEWSFYRGECGQAHSFCNLHGGSVANKTEDMGGWTASYALCTLPSGKQCQDDAFAHSCTCE